MGKKQSPFIGRRVPLVDNGVPILYPRYSSVEEILTDGSSDKKRAAPEPDAAAAALNGTAADQPAAKKVKQDVQQQNGVAAAAAADGQQQQQLSKKEKKKLKQQQQQQQQEAEPNATAAAAADEADAWAPEPEPDAVDKKQRKKEKKKLKQQQQQPPTEGQPLEQQQQQQQQQQQLAAAEATGNAEEAARIRQVLGFTAAGNSGDALPTAAAAAAAPTAAAVPKVSSGGFSFNFDNLSAEDAVAADMKVKLAAIQAVDTADKDGFVPRRVFVGGMPYSYTQEQIEEYWTWCGEIEDLDIMTFPDTGRFRGIAFITFKTQEGADAALACNGEQVDGQTLKVERCKAAAVAKSLKQSAASARNQQQQQSQRGRQQQAQTTVAAESARPAPGGGGSGGDGPARTPGYNVAYVGNIAFEARPEDISALFEACSVTKVRLHTDKDTRKSKGYAHVHFADDAGLEQAIGMSGTQFMGRPIKVSYGQPKKN